MEPSPARYEERPGCWPMKFGNGQIDMNIGGNATGPLPENIEVAQYCEGRVTELTAVASKFISENVATSAAVSGQLWLEWIDVGLSDRGNHNRFEMWFSDKADYVLWSVLFSYGTNPITKAIASGPRGFSRRAW